VSVPGQPTAFLVGQADPAAHVPTEDAVFFDQVGHGLLLPLVDQPTGAARVGGATTRRARRGNLSHQLDLTAPEGLRPSNETLRDVGGAVILERIGTAPRKAATEGIRAMYTQWKALVKAMRQDPSKWRAGFRDQTGTNVNFAVNAVAALFAEMPVD